MTGKTMCRVHHASLYATALQKLQGFQEEYTRKSEVGWSSTPTPTGLAAQVQRGGTVTAVSTLAPQGFDPDTLFDPIISHLIHKRFAYEV